MSLYMWGSKQSSKHFESKFDVKLLNTQYLHLHLCTLSSSYQATSCKTTSTSYRTWILYWNLSWRLLTRCQFFLVNMGMWCKSLGVHQFSHVTQNSKIMNCDQWATIALKKAQWHALSPSWFVWWQNKQRLNTKKRKPESAYIVNWVTDKVKEITTAFSFGIREEENTQYALGV
jgi:hypothetical protein